MLKVFLFSLIVLIGCGSFIYSKEMERRDYLENMTEPKFIKTNSIGCSQYYFKNDVFWRCPKELNITSIVETNSKMAEIQPSVDK